MSKKKLEIMKNAEVSHLLAHKMTNKDFAQKKISRASLYPLEEYPNNFQLILTISVPVIKIFVSLSKNCLKMVIIDIFSWKMAKN